jgi:hypothetical protein
MRLQFSLASLMCISAIAALFIVDQVSTLAFILIIEVILIFGGVELLHRCMPQQLREARSDNCRRMDGSISARRIGYERRALHKVKSDLLAVFLLIAISGNWLAFFVHYQVIPIPIAASAASEFDVDTEHWKQNLRNAGVDEEFEQWSVQRAHVDRSAVESQQQVVWSIWPWVILAVLGWAIGSAIFLHRAYFHIVRSYARGVASRAEQYLNLDIGRLQEVEA